MSCGVKFTLGSQFRRRNQRGQSRAGAKYRPSQTLPRQELWRSLRSVESLLAAPPPLVW